MKDDERRLLKALAEATGHVWVRALAKELGVPEKRAAYICQKWADKGWYEYGVNVLAGWLTDEGRAQARQIDA